MGQLFSGLGNQNFIVIVGAIFVLQMFQQIRKTESHLVFTAVKKVIVAWKLQDEPRQMFQPLQIVYMRQFIAAETKRRVATNIGEGPQETCGFVVQSAFGYDLQPDRRNASAVFNLKLKQNTGKGKIPVDRSHIGEISRAFVIVQH